MTSAERNTAIYRAWVKNRKPASRIIVVHYICWGSAKHATWPYTAFTQCSDQRMFVIELGASL